MQFGNAPSRTPPPGQATPWSGTKIRSQHAQSSPAAAVPPALQRGLHSSGPSQARRAFLPHRAADGERAPSQVTDGGPPPGVGMQAVPRVRGPPGLPPLGLGAAVGPGQGGACGRCAYSEFRNQPGLEKGSGTRVSRLVPNEAGLPVDMHTCTHVYVSVQRLRTTARHRRPAPVPRTPARRFRGPRTHTCPGRRHATWASVMKVSTALRAGRRHACAGPELHVRLRPPRWPTSTRARLTTNGRQNVASRRPHARQVAAAWSLASPNESLPAPRR